MTGAWLRRDLARYGVPLCLVTAGEHEMRTECTQVDRDLPADSRRRPGDHDVFVSDPVHSPKKAIIEV